MLHQIVLLFTSRFIIYTGSPLARIGPRALPTTHLDQGTPVNDINDVTGGKNWARCGLRPFFKIAATKI